MSILFKLSYGLYLLSAKDGEKNNACIVNTAMQQTATPETVSVTVNKQNLTHDMIFQTQKCVVNILNESTPFDFFKNFGMESGKDIDKFASIETISTKNGIVTNANYSAGWLELDIFDQIDLGTHTMFIGKISESSVSADNTPPITYAYYHKNTKPKPVATPAKDNEEVWVCKICNYVHKGPLSDDFICPICKHGKADFERKS